MLLTTDISNIPGWLALVLIVLLWGLVLGYGTYKFFVTTNHKYTKYIEVEIKTNFEKYREAIKKVDSK